MNKYEVGAKEFHEKYEVDINKPFSVERLELRQNLLQEELDELKVEIAEGIEKLKNGQKIDRDLYLRMVKELADVQYVLSGFAVTFGINLEEIFDLVHESNLSKLDENGKVIRREDGKILKGPNYHPPIFDSVDYE